MSDDEDISAEIPEFVKKYVPGVMRGLSWAKYSKEKNLADRFVKQKISQKLTQTESKHPLKEQYDRLFTDRTVL